ncbi:agmatine deiminase family protein [Streptacidiphilus jiangxiensis]|uniref:Agmatine deiminase n=1 Tax=Streptacidiphilus jiangxiensis TaxID=235985 RepID=A0A1H7TSZ0_STRJI|nr:agmatine deiminase family protein [Streptacidiphilus jiangxiensis]SEL87688.1 agmatine deiminase [Streptacidiphilus jiangxiensis]
MNTPEISRRRLLQFGAAAVPVVALGLAFPGVARAAGTTPALRMPAESDPHTLTFMAWPESTAAWGTDLSPVRRDIANLAKEISRYEPVVMVASPDAVPFAEYLCDTSTMGFSYGITFLQITNDDLWIRDFGPTFLAGPGAIAGVDTNFNGWGKTGTPYYQAYSNDAKVAASLLAQYNVNRIQAPFVGEGGALETDGQGTLLATVSSLVNPNRNPGLSQGDVEQRLKSTLGLDKVIWLAGLAGQDITDDHVDCLARFSAPGRVILDQPGPGTAQIWIDVYHQAKQVLQSATDAQGRSLTIVELPGPDRTKIRGTGNAFLSSYTNYYTANGAVFVPQFGDAAADEQARAILAAEYPTRTVVQLNIDVIASGGGGIHCSTQSQPAVPPAA